MCPSVVWTQKAEKEKKNHIFVFSVGWSMGMA